MPEASAPIEIRPGSALQLFNTLDPGDSRTVPRQADRAGDRPRDLFRLTAADVTLRGK